MESFLFWKMMPWMFCVLLCAVGVLLWMVDRLSRSLEAQRQSLDLLADVVDRHMKGDMELLETVVPHIKTREALERERRHERPIDVDGTAEPSRMEAMQMSDYDGVDFLL